MNEPQLPQLPEQPRPSRVPVRRQAREIESRLRRMSGTQRVTAGVIVIAVLTVILWLSGVVADAATLTAYATLVLAFGTVGLAWGAIGTYLEQRRQVGEQQHQLALAWENDIAQVRVRRISGPGEHLAVSVGNHSSRAIRAIYVWADVDGMPGQHFEAVVQDKDPRSGQDIISRRMRVFRVTFGGAELYRCLRAMLPGESEIFAQFRPVDKEPVLDVDNQWIKAQAIFSDIKGNWWKASEDGELEMLPEAPHFVAETRPPMGRGIPGVSQPSA